MIWLGTWEGVARFNGRDFTVFDRQNTPGVELGGVFVVVRDGDGMLFGTAFDGVYRYQDGRWQQLGDASARHLAVSALLRRADGALWVGTPQTLYRIELDGRVVDVGRQAGLPRARITALSTDARGDLWIGTDVGLYQLPLGASAATAWGQAHGMADTPVRRLASDRQGGLLVAGDDGVWWWSRGGGLQRFRQGQRVDSLVMDRSGHLWMSLSAGTLVMHSGPDDPDEQIAISGVASPALLEDAEGLIWVGSTHGLFRVAEGAAHGVTIDDGLASDYVRSVLQTADGTVWVGSAVGLDRWRDGQIARVPFSLGSAGRVLEQSVLALADAGDGGVWAGTYSPGCAASGCAGGGGPAHRCGRGPVLIVGACGVAGRRCAVDRHHRRVGALAQRPRASLHRRRRGAGWLGAGALSRCPGHHLERHRPRHDRAIARWRHPRLAGRAGFPGPERLRFPARSQRRSVDCQRPWAVAAARRSLPGV
ncbi:two-component regulator propeller domain-containing protein [Xanthomonas campestris]|nr:two-component regulator propeller domain-containing protein [Xanthomonas campestris]MEA9730872.1 two-component regulator propeller domain-containing protein [Xanthomonas campestris]